MGSKLQLKAPKERQIFHHLVQRNVRTIQHSVELKELFYHLIFCEINFLANLEPQKLIFGYFQTLMFQFGKFLQFFNAKIY